MLRGPGREHRTCPLGVCDGTGWILGPEDVARPCDCRERIVARARLRGVHSMIPASTAASPSSAPGDPDERDRRPPCASSATRSTRT